MRHCACPLFFVAEFALDGHHGPMRFELNSQEIGRYSLQKEGPLPMLQDESSRPRTEVTKAILLLLVGLAAAVNATMLLEEADRSAKAGSTQVCGWLWLICFGCFGKRLFHNWSSTSAKPRLRIQQRCSCVWCLWGTVKMSSVFFFLLVAKTTLARCAFCGFLVSVKT